MLYRLVAPRENNASWPREGKDTKPRVRPVLCLLPSRSLARFEGATVLQQQPLTRLQPHYTSLPCQSPNPTRQQRSPLLPLPLQWTMSPSCAPVSSQSYLSCTPTTPPLSSCTVIPPINHPFRSDARRHPPAPALVADRALLPLQTCNTTSYSSLVPFPSWNLASLLGP